MNQVQALSKWVMHFDPIDFMNSSDASNLQVKNKMDEHAFKEFSVTVMREFEEFRIEGKANKLLKRLKGSPSRGINTMLNVVARTNTSESMTQRGGLKSLQNPMDVSIEVQSNNAVGGGFGGFRNGIPGTSSHSPKESRAPGKSKPLLYTSMVQKRSHLSKETPKASFRHHPTVSAYQYQRQFNNTQTGDSLSRSIAIASKRGDRTLLGENFVESSILDVNGSATDREKSYDFPVNLDINDSKNIYISQQEKQGTAAEINASLPNIVSARVGS